MKAALSLKDIPDVDELKRHIRYDRDTGNFIRIIGTSRSPEGSVVGDIDSKGYWRVGVLGKRYLAHRLAWLYETGEWLDGEIDHKNRVRSDNRWSNLRKSDEFTNKRNTPAYRNNKSGLKGVSWHVCSKKWRSRIRINGKEVNLGLYETPEEANEAYRIAAEKQFGEFARSA